MAGAQVSGPGAMSKRTDTGGQPIRDLPDPAYGEATAFRDQQKAAPLSASSDATAPSAPYPSDIARMGQAQDAPSSPRGENLPGLFDPGDPTVPVTSGAPLGPGPNMLPSEQVNQPYRLSQELSQYAAGGGEGMAWLANQLLEMGF